MFRLLKKPEFVGMLMLLRLFVSVEEHQITLSKWKFKGQSDTLSGQQQLLKTKPALLNLDSNVKEHDHSPPTFVANENKYTGISSTLQTRRQKRAARTTRDTFDTSHLGQNFGAIPANHKINNFQIEFLPPKTHPLSLHEWTTKAPVGKSRSENLFDYFQLFKPKEQRNNGERISNEWLETLVCCCLVVNVNGFCLQDLCHFKLCHTRPFEA